MKRTVSPMDIACRSTRCLINNEHSRPVSGGGAPCRRQQHDEARPVLRGRADITSRRGATLTLMRTHARAFAHYVEIAAARRTRQVRSSVHRRHQRHLRSPTMPRPGARTTAASRLEPITLLGALAAVTRTHRPRRHHDHDLLRAVSCGALLRLARSDQRRPRGLEPRHLARGRRGLQLQPRRARAPCRPLRAR